MKVVVAAFNQEKALVGAFSVIVQPIVEPMAHYTALVSGRQSQQIIKVKGYLRYFYSLLHNAMLDHQGIMIH